MAKKLKTGWVIVATSGVTADFSGRVIQKEWLKSMANNYDPDVYAARLWPDHYRWYPNGGKVLALKTQKATNENLEGEIHLMAIIAPNEWLIEQNSQGQYLHCSIEVDQDFMDGKFDFYLGGLGVTDNEASAGTQELEFKAKAEKSTLLFKPEAINFSAELKTSFLSNIFSKPEMDDDEMNKEQYTAFSALIEANTLALSTMGSNFTALKEKIAGSHDDAGGGDEASEPEMVTAEQFTALKVELDSTVEQLKALNTQFTELRAAPAGGTNIPEGDGGQEEPLI